MNHATIDSLLRTSQAHCQQVCEKQTLDYGIAFYNEAFPAVADANQFREVWIEDVADARKAIGEGKAWFAERGLQCMRVAPAGGLASEEFANLLTESGFTRRDYTAMMLTRWPDAESNASIRVLPARAMRAVFRAVVERSAQAIDDAARAQSVSVCEERLDDPPYDMFVAMAKNRPIGCCALYQVGDVARVIDLMLVNEPDYDTVASALLTHVLGLARRLAMKNVIAQIGIDDSRRRALFERFGFIADGTLTEFHRAT